MTIISGLIKLLTYPVVFGLTAGILALLVTLLVTVIVEGSLERGVSMYSNNGIFMFLVPISVTVQMGLFRHHRNLMKSVMVYRYEKLSVSGSALSSIGMVLCCVCCIPPVSGILPALGFLLGASSFLIQYQAPIIIAGLLVNTVGSLVIIRAILYQKRDRCPATT